MEKKFDVLDFFKRLAVYLIGLLVIALGINVSKMSGLGISPVSSIPRALEVILGKHFTWVTLGNMVIVIYCVLVLLQILVLRKRFQIKNVLGVPIALIFGFMVDLVGIDSHATGHLLARINFPAPQGYIMQFIYLIVSIVLIGLGVYIYLKPSLVPMPGEGLAGAISQISGKPFGDCKTAVDVGLILTALILQLIFLGGFKSFTGDDVVVREGTIISAICVGQVVKLLNRIFNKKANKSN